MTLLVSPTEPRDLRELGKISGLVERFGCDFLYPKLRLGIQRKELRDLIASLGDRLGEQMARMRPLKYRALILEGAGRWTSDGVLMDGYVDFTRDQLFGLCATITLEWGVGVFYTKDMQDTMVCVAELGRWAAKPRHHSLQRRRKVVGEWGDPSDEQFGCFILQSWPGIGPGKAEAIFRRWGLPLAWTLTAEQLAETPGIGLKTATRIIRTGLNGHG